MKMKNKREESLTHTGLLFLLPSAVLCFVFVLLPLMNVVYYSMTEWNGVSKVKKFVGFSNYLTLPKMDGFRDMIVATFTFAIGVTLLTVIVSFAVALALEREGKGRLPRGMMRALWFFPALLSGVVVGVLWRIMYNYHNGMINAVLQVFHLKPVNWLETVGITNIAVIVGNTWVQVGLCFVIFLAGLQSIPVELYEAARIDGATSFQQLCHITFPLMAVSITINMVTTTIAAFRAYELPYLISQGLPGKTTLLMTQRIYFFGFQTREFGMGSALSVVLTIIIGLISLIQLYVLKRREDVF